MSSIVIAGDTSGSVTLQAPAVAGATILTLPATSGTVQTSGAGYTTNGVAFASSTSVLATGSALTFDGTKLGVGTSSPNASYKMTISGAGSGVIGGLALIDTDAYSFSLYSISSALVFRDITNSAERMRLDSSGRLLVGSTTSVVSGDEAAGFVGNSGISAKATNSSANFAGAFWNTATSGDNNFLTFITETGGTLRGGVTYNRAAGLTSFNTTSDYRAKDINGPVTNSGSLIDSVPVYMGKMKGATQERPMFLAHETPVYAHTGEKDAVDKDGNPKYQQMDASALIPVMWAEIQSLRQRLSAANL
jgi:hypothetical protein